VKGLSRGRYDVADTTRQLQKRKMDREAQVGELSGFLKLWFLQQEAGCMERDMEGTLRRYGGTSREGISTAVRK
jgi:hypothetical protein